MAHMVRRVRLWCAFVLALLLAFTATAGELPDPKLTPGVSRTLTKARLCTIRWGKDRRHVTAAMKREVFERYGMSGYNDQACKLDNHGHRIEIDHLISRELGGADDVDNLWPECFAGPWGAHRKDKLENRLHREVCAGRISLRAARKAIVGDWRAVYRRYYGDK